MRTNKLRRRVLSLALVFCMVLTMVPAALAAQGSQFTDVDHNSWAYPYIQDVVNKGLFNGTGEGKFSPNNTMDRGMIVTVLSRMAGVQVDNNAKTSFPDVEPGHFYTGAVEWAVQNGITEGFEDGTFRPNSPVTRAQVAVFLLRYASYAMLLLPETAAEKVFTDSNRIPNWAKDAVKTLQMAGIIAGYEDGSFQPMRNISRAEAAKLISVFLSVAKEQPDPTVEPTESTEPSESMEPTQEPTVPTEPAGPFTITFTGEHYTVFYQGEAVSEISLDKNVSYAEFRLTVEDGYEIYDITATNGNLRNMDSNYVLGGLTEDATVKVEVGLARHTVTFDPCNGEPATTVKVVHGNAVEKPKDPVKTDDVFEGWYTTAGDKWDFTVAVLSDMTLYAYWENDSSIDMTLYVDGVNGKDTNDGLTPETALKTMTKAQALIPAKVQNGTIYITGTITVSGEEAWSLNGKDCTVKRWDRCVSDLIVVEGSLTLSNITIDGNRENIDFSDPQLKMGHCLYIPVGGELTINDGTVIQNNYHYKGQGGAIYLYQGGTVIMNGGKITKNESGYTGGAIGIMGGRTEDATATFIMNGGEISENLAGSMASAISGTSYYMYIEINGGQIVNNTTKSVNNAAIYHGSKYGAVVLTGGTISGSKDTNGDASAGVYTSYDVCQINPKERGSLVLEDYVTFSNSNTSSGKLVFPYTKKPLSYLGGGKLQVMVRNLYVGAVVLSGTDEYQLTQDDFSRVQVLNDIKGAYQVVLDQEHNQIILDEIPNNDIIVYLNGVSGKDENDGLTKNTAVKTFAKAKAILKAQVDAAGTIPADANFVISLVNKVTITEDTSLSFTDFGAYAPRCMVKRDASYSSGQFFIIKACHVTMENIIFDGNKPFVKNNSAAMFSLDYDSDSETGTLVTANAGTVFQNHTANSMGGVFSLNSGLAKQDTNLIINGATFRGIEGGSGAIALTWGSSTSIGARSNCIINDILVEDCVCSNGMFYAYFGGDIVLNGGVFRNNTAKTGGSIAAIGNGSGARIIVNAPESGKQMELDGDIYLQNGVYDADGNVSLAEGCVVYIGGPLATNLNIRASLSMRKVPVAEGLNYRLTEEDLAKVTMASGDALKLDKANNQIVITKSLY